MQSVRDGSLPVEQRRAFLRFMAENRARSDAYNGKTVRQIAAFQLVYEKAQTMVGQAKAQDAAIDRKLRPLLDAKIVSARDRGNSIVFTVAMHNKTGKTIEHANLALTIEDPRTRSQVAEFQLHVDRAVPPHAAVTFDMPVSYRLFDNTATAVKDAASHGAICAVQLSRIEYADGSSAGADEDDD